MNPISKEYLRRHLPPGVPAEKAKTLIYSLLFSCTALGFIVFLCKYNSCYHRLFYYWHGQKLLRDGAIMPPFPEIVRGMWMIHCWGVIFALGYSLQLYGSFFGKSQSIYLLRRLPDRRRTLRCMVMDVPLRWALGALLLALIFTGIAWIIWRFCTPAACLQF